MELVYLWVEDYKNIHRQGFNFSPRFTCSYENNELNIIDKEETKEPYLKNFFGDNINVTAIVGENGSGKSNILEVLSNFKIDDKIFLKVYFDNDKLVYTVNNKKIKINTLYEKREEIDDITVLYTEIPSMNSLNNDSITNISFWSDVQKEKYSISENIELVKSRMQTHHMILMKKYNFLPGVNKKPKNIEFSFNHHYFDDIRHDDIDEIWKKIFIILMERDEKRFEQAEDISTFSDYNDDVTKRQIKEFIKKNITNENTISWLNNLEDIADKFVENYNNIISSSDIQYSQQLISSNNELFDDEFYGKYISTFKIYIDFEDFSEDLLNSIIDLFSYSRAELIINLCWDISLSTGEESFLNLFASLYYCIKSYSYKFQDINIIIDEIEAYLHPSWQVEFIKNLISFFKLQGIRSARTNIILTSHSPFILSDLPKENVIFLEKGKQVYPFENGQTFGANIHTLLSDGFFMKDGLMGEFAKGKINQAVEYLKQDEPSEEKLRYCKEIIPIIGEPILKATLETMLDNKLYLKETKLDKLKRQQKEIEEAIEKEKGKSDEKN